MVYVFVSIREMCVLAKLFALSLSITGMLLQIAVFFAQLLFIGRFGTVYMGFQKITSAIKKSKLLYYTKSLTRYLVPSIFHQSKLNKRLALVNKYHREYIFARLNYYNKLSKPAQPGSKAIPLGKMPVFKSPKAYNFDTFEYTRYFSKSLKANFLFGDVQHFEEVPTLQKSRPIAGENPNAILLKLDKKRHFVFIKDPTPFADKKDMMIGRGTVSQPHRIRFWEMYFNHPMFDLGQVNKKGGNPAWLKPKIPISAHLQYKFILSLEGHDVATNLKWIMSSNSIAVMPAPVYETWFMEGTLIPDHHYIQIKSDYSDVEEKLNYYLQHPHKAQAIISNANKYVSQFMDKQREDLLSLLVLEKYFYYTGQIDAISV
jgi:hypothetical protein